MELANLQPRQKFEKLLETLQELEHLSGLYSMNSGSFEAEHLPVSQRALVPHRQKIQKIQKNQKKNSDDDDDNSFSSDDVDLGETPIGHALIAYHVEEESDIEGSVCEDDETTELTDNDDDDNNLSSDDTDPGEATTGGAASIPDDNNLSIDDVNHKEPPFGGLYN